jgi:hypothetical protein
MGKRRLAYEVDKQREGHYVLFVIGANGDIIKECERRLRVIDAVIKYITVRTDEETRRFEKIRSYRLKRAARRGSSAGGASSQLQKRPCRDQLKKNVLPVRSSITAGKKFANFVSSALTRSITKMSNSFRNLCRNAPRSCPAASQGCALSTSGN